MELDGHTYTVGTLQLIILGEQYLYTWTWLSYSCTGFNETVQGYILYHTAAAYHCSDGKRDDTMCLPLWWTDLLWTEHDFCEYSRPVCSCSTVSVEWWNPNWCWRTNMQSGTGESQIKYRPTLRQWQIMHAVQLRNYVGRQCSLWQRGLYCDSTQQLRVPLMLINTSSTGSFQSFLSFNWFFSEPPHIQEILLSASWVYMTMTENPSCYRPQGGILIHMLANTTCIDVLWCFHVDWHHNTTWNYVYRYGINSIGILSNTYYCQSTQTQLQKVYDWY